MADLEILPIKVPWLEVLIFFLSIGLIFAVFNHTVLNDSTEQLPILDVPIPKQCHPGWRGEVLEETSVRASCLVLKLCDQLADAMCRYPEQVLYNVTAQPMDSCSGLSTQLLLTESIER